MLACTFQYVCLYCVCQAIYTCVFPPLSSSSVRLTWEVEAVVPMAFGRGVGRWSGAGGVALLEGRRGGRCGRGGGGRIAAGVQLVQHWRMILVGQGRMQTTQNQD